jgi:hypothetical protein
MRAKVLIALVLSCALAGCYSRTVEERQPVVVQQPPRTNTVVVPGTTVVCPPGSVC